MKKLILTILILSFTSFLTKDSLLSFNFSSAVAQTTPSTYYLSPNGNDNNLGNSEGSPWTTFNRAWQSLYPGDTLIVMDGTYYQNILPNRRGGQSNNPITVKAQHDGKAIIDGQYQRIPVQLGTWNGDQNGWYWVLEGIVAQNSSGSVYYLNGNNNILRRISGYNANPDGNDHVFTSATNSSNNLIEDCIAAGSGRKMAFAYSSTNITFRRCFVYWQKWDGRTFRNNEWPWGNGLEMYNSSDGIIENGIAIGAYPDVGLSILSNVSNTFSPNPANDNKLLGSMIVGSGMFDDGTPWKWGMSRPDPAEGGLLKRMWEWPGQGIAVKVWTWGANAVIQNTQVQDIFSYGNMRLGLGTSAEDPNSYPVNTTVNRVTILNNRQDPWMPVSQDGPVGMDVISDEVAHFNITNSKIGKACSQANKSSCVDNPYTSEGARLAHRYVDGVLKDGSDGTPVQALWPWSMQDRIIKETGLDITGKMTDLLIDQGVPTGKNIKAPVISPQPPEGAVLNNIPGTVYLSPVTVTLSSNTTGATIRYTLDESEPTTSSPIYSGPFTLDQTTLVKTKVFANGEESHLRSAYYLINLSASNQAPEVDANLDPFINPYMEIVLPNKTVNLYGTVSDQTLPTGGSITSTWTQVSGPTATITDPAKPRTTATVSSAGDYVFRLTATDGALSTSKDVTVKVWPNDLVGITHQVPGRIEAENYRSGGEGVGYYQVHSYGDGLYRQGSRVGVGYAYNDNQGYSVMHVRPQEWYAYDISASATDDYTLNLRYYATYEDAIIHFEIDDVDVSGPVTLTGTGGASRKYGTISVPIGTLLAGNHTLKVIADQAPTGQIDLGIGLNYFEFSPSQTLSGDLNDDNIIDHLDMEILLNNWSNPRDRRTDLNSDGVVNGVDFGLVLKDWGSTK